MDDLSSQRPRILIVENDRVTARDLESALRRRGFRVAGVAYTAAQALESIALEKPDLVLLDLELENPGDGIELAGRLREEFGLPFLFVTGYSEEAVLERARAVEPAGFLRKPFSDAEVLACLDAVVGRRSAGDRLSLRLPGLRSASAELPQAVFVTTLEGLLVHLNPAAESLTGWSLAEVPQQPLSLVAPLRDADGEVSGGGRRAFLTTRRGATVPVEERSVPIRTKDGEAIGLVTVMAAVTATATASPAGAAPAPAAPAETPPEGRPVPTAGLVSAPGPASIQSPAPAARTEALRKIASLASDPAFKELIARKKPTPSPSATLSAIEVVVASASEPGETPATSPLVVTGESPRAQGGAAAPESTGLAEVGDPLLRFDEEGTIRYANAEAVRVFGGGAVLTGSSLHRHFEEGDLDRYEVHFTRPLQDGRRHRFDFHDSRRGLWFEVRAYPTAGGVLVLFTDITATRLEAAEQLRQHRLEGLGLLARGFAHDFNNSLTTLTGNISLARERYPDDAVLQGMLEEAQGAASKATGLVQQLMTFARGGRPIRERTRIPELIRRILTEQRLKHPEIRFQYQGSDPEVVANVDPAQVGRLVENLVVNSVAAMPDGGVLVVRSSRLRPEEVLRIRGSHTPSDEDHLLVEVIDTGHGMSASDLERVFEPYFTTRRENNATGIGLTVCESIAKAHGGFLQLQSKEGKGTIATFCVPLGRRAEDTVPAGGEPAYPNFDLPLLREAPSSKVAGEPLLVGTRILILEDDAPIRRLMAATLRRAGHEVVETKDGRETLAIYEDALKRGERFHLLICDLTIENGMGGVETMRRILEIDPEVLAIVSSGYSDAPAMSSPASFGFKGVLPKPYAPTELRAAVHRILTAHRIIP